MAIGLQRAGRRDFVVLDKRDGVGGTWRDNRYPGVACDVPSHLYSFSTHQKADWSRAYAPGDEIRRYLEDCVDRAGLAPHLRLGERLRSARWSDEAGGHWQIETDRASEQARSLVLALGPLHLPQIPELPGADRFAGRAVHTARWPDDLDLTGKRVAVIGTGASAIQVVPAIVDRVAALTVFQRTPPWLLSRHDRPIGPTEQRLYRDLPGALALRRAGLWLRGELRGTALFEDPRLMAIATRMAQRHLRAQVADPALRRRLTPDYTIGCKRILLSDDYYPALQRPHVRLVDGGAARLDEHGVVDAHGDHHAADVIVWATGFQTLPNLTRIPVVGRDGRSLAETWAAGAEAFLGTVVHGFPNLYLLLGPNTGLGHSSMVLMIEAQVRLVLDALGRLDRPGARPVEIRAEAQAAFNAGVQRDLQGTVWQTGCHSWYLDEDGTNRTLWPHGTWRFMRETGAVADGAWEE
ncbi:MAG: NAD(P)/FAD-dependent oxidoreductase [Alphaproteobacteria bacterium]|nr:NAD(P)/FAD-dependent oxidoreductase [Alphaproteobacteria bacterium]